MDPKTNLFTTHGNDLLVYKKGGGRIALFGLPFFLAGLFVAQIPFGIIPVDVEGGPLVLAILLPLGPLFAGVGFVLMLSPLFWLSYYHWDLFSPELALF